MSVIAHTNFWSPYVTPSFGGRPTENISSLDAWNFDTLSVPAREPRLFASHATIDRLASLSRDWDTYGSVTPHPIAVERSRQLLEEAFRAAAVGWQAPHISASEEGEIVLEWWNGPRKLTIYVGPEVTTFLKSWGPHVIDDMADGVLAQNWDPELWAWLFH